MIAPAFRIKLLVGVPSHASSCLVLLSLRHLITIILSLETIVFLLHVCVVAWLLVLSVCGSRSSATCLRPGSAMASNPWSNSCHLSRSDALLKRCILLLPLSHLHVYLLDACSSFGRFAINLVLAFGLRWVLALLLFLSSQCFHLLIGLLNMPAKSHKLLCMVL